MAEVAGEAYSVGDIGPAGGVIFITPSTSGNTTGYYFEVAPSNFALARTWAQSTPTNYQSTAVTGADATAIGTGYQNTLDIVAQGNSTSTTSAAAYCRSLTINTYSDWFLPSKDEVNQIYLNIPISGFGTTTALWTSSEITSTGAYLHTFNGSSASALKSASNTAAPVRMFSAPRTKYPETSEIARYGSQLPTQRIGNDTIYGTGLDGNVYVNTAVTLTSDMYYQNLEVTSNGVLHTNGFKVFVKGTLTLNGFIGMGSVSSGVIGESASNVASGTVSGHTTSTISYRMGGQGGGSTDPGIPLLPTFLYKNINNALRGTYINPATGFVAIAGGSKGTTGTAGATANALTAGDSWTGKAGAVGTNGAYGPSATTANAPGGRGVTASDGNANGTPGPGGAGGTGGAGGGVVAIFAKTITGSGSLFSIGSSGVAGSAGTAGAAGTTGANGAAAPNRTDHAHTPPGTSHAPHARNHDHHDHTTRHSDFHAHYQRGGDHHSPASHTHHPVHKGSPYAAHTPASHHENPHHHHTGSYHHPHNDGPHGGAHHWENHHWHARYQVHHGSVLQFSSQKPNGHHTHANPPGDAHHHNIYFHGYTTGGNSGAHGHAIYTHPGHTHTHVPSHPSSSARYHHHPHSVTHPNPDTATHYLGGAGGVNDGVNTGRGAPAQTGGTGKRGGAGGGGAILVICDTIGSGVQFDNRAGLLEDADNFSKSAGSSYIIYNR